MTFLEKAKAVMIGHAIGDALGVPVEFITRQELKENPVTDMKGYGTYPVPAGAWSDDTSMALCALETFNGCKINFDKVMINFARWYYQDLFTPTGEMFDVGNTCSMAIEKYMKENVSWHECGLMDERSNGNGSLMRILPIAYFIYFLSQKYSFSQYDMMESIHNLSCLTHAHKRSQMACGIYVLIAIELLKAAYEGNGDNLSLEEIVDNGLSLAKEYYYGNPYFKHQLSHFDRVFSHAIQKLPRDEIQSGGYVISTLEASIWCLLNNESYRETALAAVNLGGDTDTTACVVGGLAGIYYGYDDIPSHWLEQIARFDYIDELLDNFADYLSENIGD